MRAKEAVDMEAKAAQRSVEKQLRLLERAQEVEMSLRSQIVCGFIVCTGDVLLTFATDRQ